MIKGLPERSSRRRRDHDDHDPKNSHALTTSSLPLSLSLSLSLSHTHTHFPLKKQLRRVLDVIRGRSYEEALMILEFLPYRAAEPVLATLISAASNAKNNNNASKAKLYVSECFADQAGQLKRFRPRAKGRPFKILKPINHLTIKVAERP